MFGILIGKKANKILQNLDEKTKIRFDQICEVLTANPWPAKDFDLSKIEGMEDCFRIRIGKYRICYHTDTNLKEITIFKIDLKSETTYK
jgi:mRNA-degrading endonuclease RelE of RelBE toxin-antitoxin system